MKVVSLVPSITEALLDLGLTDKEVVGRTKFCIHPAEKVQNIPKIGGTKNLNIDLIKSLKPDLILANKEENIKEQVEELQKHFNVLVTDIASVDDTLNLNRRLGQLFHKETSAEKFNAEILKNLRENQVRKKLKVAYLIWKKPYMTVGGDTYISHILEAIGCINLFEEQNRYPEITVDNLKDADVVFLSSEPYPFKEKDIQELKEHLQEVPVILVDGEVFSWYGTHLAKKGAYLKELVTSLNSI